MSTAPVLLPDGQVMLAGKSRIVYLLNGAHLGGIGHQQAEPSGRPAATTSTAACRSPGHDRLPALPRRHRRGPGHKIPARDAPAVEFRDRRRAPHHRRGPGLDHRAERHAVRARSGHRPGAAAGSDRHASQPFPDAEHGRWPPAGRRARTTSSPSPRLLLAPRRPRPQPGGAHGRPGPFGTRGFGLRTHFRPRDIAAIALGALVVIAGLGWFLWRRRKGGRQTGHTSSPNRDDFWQPPSG